jgi:tRNA A37 N6-isopentenylltransferase MiaA
MAQMKTLTGKVETHEQYKTPHRIYDIDSKTRQKSPDKIAETTRAGTFSKTSRVSKKDNDSWK